MSLTPPDNPIVVSGDENVIPMQMDDIPQPIVKNFSDFMYNVVVFGCLILLWSLVWVAINAITLKMGFASPLAMRVVWAIPLLGVLGTILTGTTTLGWSISIFVLSFITLAISLVIGALFGLYSQNQLPAPLR
jgi:hypothetical protein